MTRARMAYTTSFGALATFFAVVPESRQFVLDVVSEPAPITVNFTVGALCASLAGRLTYTAMRIQHTKKRTRASQRFHDLAHSTRNAKLRLNYTTDREKARLRNTVRADWTTEQATFHLDMKRLTERKTRDCLDLLVQHLNKLHKRNYHGAFLQLVCADTHGDENEIKQVSVWEVNAALFAADRKSSASVNTKYPQGRQGPQLIENDTALNHLCSGPITHYFTPSLRATESNGYQTSTENCESNFGAKVVVPIRRPFYSERDGAQQIVHGFLTVLFKDDHAGVRIPSHPPNLSAGERSEVLSTIAAHADSLASFFDNYAREITSYDDAWENRQAQLGELDRRKLDSEEPPTSDPRLALLDKPRTIYYSARVAELVYPRALARHEESKKVSPPQDANEDSSFIVRTQTILARRYPFTKKQLHSLEHIDIGVTT